MKENRIEQEKRVLDQMVRIYCKGQRHKPFLCKNCQSLIEYAYQQLSVCKFGENKNFCSKCTVHCYKPEMKEFIKKVMIYSGPRMILYNPLMAIRHLIKKL